MSDVPANLVQRYPTPSTSPDGTQRRAYFVPDDLRVFGAWNEALALLTAEDVWDDSAGGMSATDTAALLTAAQLWETCPPVNNGGDGDMTVIIPYTQLSSSAEFIELAALEPYDVLDLLLVLRTDRLSNLDRLSLMFNDDDGTNYRWWVSFVNAAYRYDPYSPVLPLDILAGDLGTVGYFSTFHFQIVRGANWFLHGDFYRREASNNGHIGQIEGMWKSNADITKITIEALYGDFVAGCAVLLRGL